MSTKNVLAVAGVVLILVLAATYVVIFRKTEPPAPKPPSAIPQPYFVSPGVDDRSPGHPVLLTGDIVHLAVLEMNMSRDVVWTRFEYNDGASWKIIGIDYGASDNMNLSRKAGYAGLFGGFLGWETDWNTASLADGNYSIRATMRNHEGSTGSITMGVSYERNPPAPRLEGGNGQIIRGNWTFNATTEDQDGQLLVLHYWDGSNSSHDQGPGVGGTKQSDVGPTGDPPSGIRDNMFCAPSAAANGLMRLGQKDARILNATDFKGNNWTAFIAQNIKHFVENYPDDKTNPFDKHDDVKSFYENQTKNSGPYVKDGKLTNLGLAMVLACKMRTDIDNGTTFGNQRAGLRDFLREQGIDGNYTVSGWNFEDAQATGSPNGSAWGNLTRVIRENETVTINLYFENATMLFVHSLTAKDFKVVEGQKGPPRRTVSVVDPRGTALDLPFREDKNGNGYVIYNGLGCYILNITSVSPDDSTRNKYFSAAFLPVRNVNFDEDDRDGWAVAWATATVNDGFYLVRATMVDDRNNLGRATVEVLVDNRVPAVQLQPLQAQGATIPLAAIETTGSEDVEFMTFSFSRDGNNWTVIGTDADGSDGWGIVWEAGQLAAGNYFVRAATTDYAGNDGFAVAGVNVPPH